MIREVSGDILLSKAQAIAHGIAPNDHFDQGLAKSLREMWPALAKDFRHYCHNENPQPGEVFVWGAPDGKRYINLLTQEPARSTNQHPGKAQTEYVHHALRELKKLAEKEKFSSIALPRLATGVGGLDWHEVKPLVEQHLGSLGIPVYVYTEYKANQQAAEN